MELAGGGGTVFFCETPDDGRPAGVSAASGNEHCDKGRAIVEGVLPHLGTALEPGVPGGTPPGYDHINVVLVDNTRSKLDIAARYFDGMASDAASGGKTGARSFTFSPVHYRRIEGVEPSMSRLCAELEVVTQRLRQHCDAPVCADVETELLT